MMIFDDIGGVGVPKVPKMDDVIYEQSLMGNNILIMFHYMYIKYHIGPLYSERRNSLICVFVSML